MYITDEKIKTTTVMLKKALKSEKCHEGNSGKVNLLFTIKQTYC